MLLNGVAVIDLSDRQKEILEIVKASDRFPVKIAARLNVSRAALRPCLAVLTMSGCSLHVPASATIYRQRQAQPACRLPGAL